MPGSLMYTVPVNISSASGRQYDADLYGYGPEKFRHRYRLTGVSIMEREEYA